MFVIIVFFFKQKTAYEMRISDWSSDVCSSDLAGVVGVVVAVDRAELAVVGQAGQGAADAALAAAQQGQRVARVEAERGVELVLAAEAPACADPRLFGGLEQQVGADLVARVAVDDGQHGGIARGIAMVRLRLCKRIRCGAKGEQGGNRQLEKAQSHDLESTRFPDRSSRGDRSEEHTSELQSLMRISYAVFCLKKKNRYMITMFTTAYIDVIYKPTTILYTNTNDHQYHQ